MICSDFVESNYVAMPLDSVKDSPIFTQLSYYHLSVPVVPLPMALNDEAIHVGSQFLRKATGEHQRFLALADNRSYKTLDWLAREAAAKYDIFPLETSYGIKVIEFRIKAQDNGVRRLRPR